MDERTQEEIVWEEEYHKHREVLVRRDATAELAHREVKASGGTLNPLYALKMFSVFIKENISIWEQVRTIRRKQVSVEALLKNLTMEVDGLHDNRARADEQITLALERIDQFVKKFKPVLERAERDQQEADAKVHKLG
jgi:hypothetical protein